MGPYAAEGKMPGEIEGLRPAHDAAASVLPDLENASRAELQLALEQLERANRRLSLLNRVATRLMNDTQTSFSDLFDEMASEIGARFFFYQRVDSLRPEVLLLAAASEQSSEEEAARSNDILASVARLTGPGEAL